MDHKLKTEVSEIKKSQLVLLDISELIELVLIASAVNRLQPHLIL